MQNDELWGDWDWTEIVRANDRGPSPEAKRILDYLNQGIRQRKPRWCNEEEEQEPLTATMALRLLKVLVFMVPDEELVGLRRQINVLVDNETC